MPKIYWSDTEDIALALSERFPDLDPLTVRFTDMRQWISEIEDFADDLAASSEGKLEAVQMAWLEEYKDRG